MSSDWQAKLQALKQNRSGVRGVAPITSPAMPVAAHSPAPAPPAAPTSPPPGAPKEREAIMHRAEAWAWAPPKRESDPPKPATPPGDQKSASVASPAAAPESSKDAISAPLTGTSSQSKVTLCKICGRDTGGSWTCRACQLAQLAAMAPGGSVTMPSAAAPSAPSSGHARTPSASAAPIAPTTTAPAPVQLHSRAPSAAAPSAASKEMDSASAAREAILQRWAAKPSHPTPAAASAASPTTSPQASPRGSTQTKPLTAEMMKTRAANFAQKCEQSTSLQVPSAAKQQAAGSPATAADRDKAAWRKSRMKSIRQSRMLVTNQLTSILERVTALERMITATEAARQLAEDNIIEIAVAKMEEDEKVTNLTERLTGVISRLDCYSMDELRQQLTDIRDGLAGNKPVSPATSPSPSLEGSAPAPPAPPPPKSPPPLGPGMSPTKSTFLPPPALLHSPMPPMPSDHIASNSATKSGLLDQIRSGQRLKKIDVDRLKQERKEQLRAGPRKSVMMVKSLEETIRGALLTKFAFGEDDEDEDGDGQGSDDIWS